MKLLAVAFVWFLMQTYTEHQGRRGSSGLKMSLSPFSSRLCRSLVGSAAKTLFRVRLQYRQLRRLNFAKVTYYPAYQNSIIRKKFTVSFLKYQRLKLKLRVFLAGHSVALVTYCVTKIIPTCSPVIGQFFDTMIVASIDKKW